MRSLYRWFRANYDDIVGYIGTALVVASAALIALFFFGCGMIAAFKIWALTKVCR